MYRVRVMSRPDLHRFVALEIGMPSPGRAPTAGSAASRPVSAGHGMPGLNKPSGVALYPADRHNHQGGPRQRSRTAAAKAA
jgi:hypothetical protein